ncbi:MAG TPA: helix-turn-helix domain-containing protein [Actinomycetales bacterium]|nr:helix-turn-helix domain-containing protein [Actinomycetales bacterium]
MSGRLDPTNVDAVAALADPVRRSLFELVRSVPGAVTREDAAGAVGISRKLAAFHLDKLVQVGLVAVDTAAAAGRVGRRPRVYRLTSATDVQVSIPARKHQLLAKLLLEAVTHQGPDEDGVAAALRVSRQRGRDLGSAERELRRPGRLAAERALSMLSGLLLRLGYEPSRHDARTVQFRSCPFHPLAAESPQVTCGIHHAYISGLVEGLGATTVEAILAPGSNGCCVELRERSQAEADAHSVGELD